MAQTGYSKVQIYSSSTATNTPSAGNLTNDTNGSELAINITDGKLFYKDNSGTVQVLATKGGAFGTVTSVAATVPSFLSISGSPITSSGTLAIGLSGTALPTTNGGTGLTSFTANQVFYASSTSAFAQSANLLYSGTDLTVYGLTVGRGAGAVSTNTAVGASALAGNSTGATNTAVGYQAGLLSTVSNQTFVGYAAGAATTTGAANTALGSISLISNTTGANNVALGAAALYSNTTASNNTAVGYQAGYSATGAGGAYFGIYSGQNATGNANTLIGNSAGYLITSGAKNTVLGGYSGNQGGLDIRTASNNIVLSDGDGNTRFWVDSYGNSHMGLPNSVTITSYSNGGDPAHTIGNMSSYPSVVSRLNIQDRSSNFITWANGSGTSFGVVSVNGAGVTYGSNSDYRLKEDISPLTGALERISALKPVKFKWIIDGTLSEGFIAHEVQGVIPLAVRGEKDAMADDGSGRPLHQTLDVSMIIATLTAAIQELKAEVDSLKAQINGASA